jgi:FtsP/CotA-like multicopper oxidase with cupredoxin domain
MINPRFVSVFAVAAIAAASFSLALATSLFVTFPLSGQQEAAAQQQNETTNATTTTTQSITPPASSNNTFSIFTSEVPGLEETYIYSLPVIVANRGDSVTVSLHNTEGTTEEEGGEATEEGGEATEGRHSFTMDAQPYSVDIDTAAGETGNASITADQEGIFQYHCKYHPETMTGQLVVLPPSSPGGSPPAT